ncbi:unnamed protein product [Caenorhabditis bovis]|uniref:RGS domain-containing protein n=1 Tax=Caenorhabditis bovis TaxID=2654633 RepID=A0A8S1EXQ6_9PELO|nr:unnamed protein product [Caenorhabditis bovis]
MCDETPQHDFQRLPSQFRRMPSNSTLAAQHQQAMAMFDPNVRTSREAPPKPDPSGVEYPRAASWAAGSCANVLNDEKGRQLFRCFLFQSLAEENLSFIEAVDKLKKMKSSDEKKFAKHILDTYASSINLSSNAMKRMKDTIESDSPDLEEFAPAVKEVKRLLENDQFPRFRRSDIYLEFLEELLPRSYAEKWATSFEALLGNHVGRHHFRLFLREIHAEENLRFWEAVVEFRSSKNKSSAMVNLGNVILKTYLQEGTLNEVFLPFGVRQLIERRINDREVDITLFDEAIKHVEQVLRNDPYVLAVYLASATVATGCAVVGCTIGQRTMERTRVLSRQPPTEQNEASAMRTRRGSVQKRIEKSHRRGAASVKSRKSAKASKMSVKSRKTGKSSSLKVKTKNRSKEDEASGKVQK